MEPVKWLESQPPNRITNHTFQKEGAGSVTADNSPHEAAQSSSSDTRGSTVSRYLVVAAALFVLGLIISTLAAFQLILPGLLSGIEYATYGRLAPAGRALLWLGWLPLAGFGLTFYVLTQVTGKSIKRERLGTAGLVLISVGALGAAGSVIAGLSTGITGQEGPLWVRAILGVGFLLSTISITATARQRAERLGAAGWYLTAGAWWLTASSIFALAPLASGTAGSIQAAFATAGMNRLFVVSMAVGLLYFVFSKISGTSLTDPRPLAALGFWSLALTWGFMGGVHFVYSATPDWYETLTIAFAIGAFVPALTIATDLALTLRGRVQHISNRSALRYGAVAGLALIGATVANLLLSLRSTSAVVGYSTWAAGLDTLILLGGASFAIFAGNSARRGSSGSRRDLHFALSVAGFTGVSVALLAGGIASGFSWIAAPSSQLFSNFGPGYEIAVTTLRPFLWVAAASLALFAVAQVLYLARINTAPADNTASADSPELPDEVLAYDLQFEGAIQYITWKRLVLGSAAVWVSAGLFTAALPMMDHTDTAPTMTADRFRTYAPGSLEEWGRNIYIIEGCSECHTQSVRPIVTDVGLGPVSIAGDYAHENPALITGIRFGPDLMHVAGRDDFDPVFLKSHLIDPRAARPWSIMPSYAHLSEAEINALVSYIETLR